MSVALRKPTEKDAREIKMIESALRTMDTRKLSSMTDFILDHKDIVIETKFWKGSSHSVEIKGPPLCILLEVIKQMETLDHNKAMAALDVVVNDWRADVNRPFEAKVRICKFLTNAYEITCTPLSWLFYGDRHNDTYNTDVIKMCVNHLKRLGADINAPFCLTIMDKIYFGEMESHKDIFPGRSLLSAAIERHTHFGRMKPLSVADVLLEAGARFNPNDPQPFCTALRTNKDSPTKVVELFYKYWSQGIITPWDVFSQDEDGQTAMHILVRFICEEWDITPNNPDLREMLMDSLDKMFQMGFTLNTVDSEGVSVIECIENPSNYNAFSDLQKEFLEIMRKEKMVTDRTMRMASHQVLRARGLPLELMQVISHKYDIKNTLKHKQAERFLTRIEEQRRRRTLS